MKISINKIKIIPKTLRDEFGFCVFGEPSDEVKSWIEYHGLETSQSGHFTNINVKPEVKLSDIFEVKTPFKYMDGFSPNLNKKLHLGHFSNLVLAKTFKSLGICKDTVSIFGDTLDGSVSKEDALLYINEFIATNFEYKPSKTFYASEVKYNGTLLEDGEGKYEGTKVFKVGKEKIVAVKGDGSTTYFCQDVALAESLDAPTLYLTGQEQCNHFRILKGLFPHIEHVGLGLVKVSGKKMSSREGNVILMEEFIDEVIKHFEKTDFKLAYNIFAGFILKSSPESDKNVNMDDISDPKKSEGLYVSYTMARLKSAGVEYVVAENPLQLIEFSYLKAKNNFAPNILFDAVIDLCKEINGLYVEHTIQGNDENKKMFEEKLSQVLWGCQKLGMFFIEKV
jgi:arginyl-tRNA synthetase